MSAASTPGARVAEARHRRSASAPEPPLRVALLTRRPLPAISYSIEHIVDDIATRVGPGFAAEAVVSRYASAGLWPRLYNVVEAAMQRADVYHVTGDVHFLTYLLPGERTLLTVHDLGRISGPPDLSKLAIRLLWFEVPVRQAAAVTVVSRHVHEQLCRLIPAARHKTHVVHVAVSERFVRQEKAFDQACPTVLLVGTSAYKNLPRALRALSGLRCRLSVIGVLSAAQRALLEASGLPYENHVGLSTEQLAARYAAADLLLFASEYEGFGMPIVEAQRVGRPVVTGNTTSMPEIAGEGACLVDPFDVGSIRAGVRRVIDDAGYRAELVARGYENAQRFDPQRIVEQYAALYRGLAGR